MACSLSPGCDHESALDRYAAPVAARAVSVLAGALGDDVELLGAAALARSPDR
jgi:hypothetical protein